jgi:hypothetical protein
MGKTAPAGAEVIPVRPREDGAEKIPVKPKADQTEGGTEKSPTKKGL